jgi:hypothetical protein
MNESEYKIKPEEINKKSNPQTMPPKMIYIPDLSKNGISLIVPI